MGRAPGSPLIVMIITQYVLATIPGANFESQGQLPPTGQVYIILSKADGQTVKTSDESTISGVGIVEVRA